MQPIIRLSLLAWTGVALGLPIATATAPALAPEVSLSLRGVDDPTIEVGEPLFVAVRIEAPEDNTTAIKLAPATGTWADRVEVRVAGSAKDSPALWAKPVARPESAAVTLDGENVVGAVWFLSSTTTGKLAPGDYRVRAQLAINDGNGWKGDAGSDEVMVQVVAPSSKTARVRQRTIALAYEAELGGSPQESARLLDGLLAGDPDNVTLLTSRAALCARAGAYRAALTCVNRAMSRVEREKWTHPPIELFELEDRVVQALMTAGGSQAVLPDWTRLPASVLAPLPDERLAKEVGRPNNTRVIDPLPGAPGAPAIASGPVSVAVVPSAGLDDAKVIADPLGQWAAGAAARSQYGRTQYAPAQATGAPNIPVPGNSPDAWCPESKNSGTDWLEVTFAKPVHATEVRVRQNDAAGAITKIEAIEANGRTHVWWTGTDPYQAPATREIVWFGVRVEKTDYLVEKVKITLNLAAVPGWKEIDAVQLVGTLN